MPTFGPQMFVGDVVEVVSYTQTTDQAGLNVFHYEVTALNAGATNSISRISDGVNANGMPTALRALISSTAAFRGLTVRRVNAPVSIAYPDLTGAGVGGVAGDLLPRQVAGLISKKSAIAGRRKGGRFYVPFPGEADNDATGLPTADYLDRMTTLGTALTSLILWGTVGSAKPVILKRPVTTRDIDLWVVRPKWATQRRRGSFGRINVPGPT